MRFEVVRPGSGFNPQVEAYFEGPNTREEFDEIRQKSSQDANRRVLTSDELDAIHDFVDANRNAVFSSDEPQVIVGPHVARVLMRVADIIEIYGHGESIQSQVLYPRSPAFAAQAQTARYPDSQAIRTLTINL